jgi:hypothetical protein
MCLYENASYVPPFAWFSQGSNAPQFSQYYYYGTSTSMHATNGSGNGVSAARNLSTSCTGYLYANSYYTGGVYTMGPQTADPNLDHTTVGDDQADSLYWAC